MMALQDLYTKQVSTQREKLVDDNAGGSKRTWEEHLSGVDCRIVESSGRWELTVSGNKITRSHLMYSDADIDIKMGDKVIDGENKFKVVFVKHCEDKDSIHHLEASLEKL